MEIFRALGALIEPPAPEHRRLADLLGLGTPPDPAAYTDLFLFQLYPYASVYLGPEGMLGGEARDRVAGFWRALGQTPPPEPDHLAVMLALHARLGELEREGEEADRARWRHARRAFLGEHLSPWLPPFLAKLADLAPPFYREWGRVLAEALAAEAVALGRPEELPLHLREAPPLPDPRTAEEGDFLQALLAPVRSGLILVRDDLRRAARELDLGARVGERRFVLQALLAQDPTAALAWLAHEARTWARRHRTDPLPGPALAEFWAARAEATAAAVERRAGR